MNSIRLIGTLAASAVIGLSVLSATSGLAQTVPPGAAAGVPLLPGSDTPPPNTDVPASLADLPTIPVVFSYFGPAAIVYEFLLPPILRATGPTGCYSAPNATTGDSADPVLFGTKPAGTEFIGFFMRGTRIYAFDTTGGNYCWIDSSVTRA